MGNSKIKITFNDDLLIDDYISFSLSNENFPGITIPLSETWVNFRSSNHQVSLGVATGISGERSAINYVTSFALDYGNTGFIITRSTNEVIIECPESYLSIESPLSNTSNVSFEIFEGNYFGISGVEFEQALSSPCSNIRVKVTTTELAIRVTNPISINPNNDNPFYFETLRGGGSFKIQCKNASEQIAIKTIIAPPALSLGNVAININNFPTGATISINVLFSQDLSLQYSLDDMSWQSSNTFNGLAASSYVLYIKDQYGCKVSKNFIVDDFGIQTPYFLISKANSIRYANRVKWGDCDNYKNDENSLSCETDVPLAYTEIQQFQSCDIITTQFKSNYNVISASIIKENGDEITLNIEQKTNNMRQKNMRDAIKYNLGNGKTGIYFTSGNMYDYDSGFDTGEDYTLNGTLPFWGIVGNYIKLASSWFLIEDIIYDESKNADVLVIDNIFTGVDTVVQVSCLYNLFNYEVYEFTIDMFDYLNEIFQVRLKNNHDAFEDIEHLSELIIVKKRHDNTVEICYKNKHNTDMFYATGIENKIRLPIRKVVGKISEKSETHKTDTTAILLNSEIHELDEFEFEPITKQMMHKLVQALSHSYVTINGLSYVKSDNQEIEGPLGETNLYIVKASMIKTSNVYNSENGDGGNLLSNDVVEIPGLIDSGNGYVIY